ncbi:23196_t:CDS:2, partial [Gigaspora margarita]
NSMNPQETTTIDTTDLLDYYLEELTEMERYFNFEENIAEIDELNSEQEVNEEVLYGFLEDNYNAKKITLRAMIDEIRNEAIIFNYEKDIVDKEYYEVIGSIQRQSTVPRIMTTKKTLQKRNHYSKFGKDKMNENRSLQELPESINTIDRDHITSEKENYTDSNEISDNDCYTNNAISDKENREGQ